METTQTTNKATNDLRHSILSHDAEGNPMYIKISLNDECHNGHQDFAITCDIYQKGKPKNDKYWMMGGCCHEEIVKARPDLKTFVNLHLCDYNGIPTYAVENGFYHLTHGFNNTKIEDATFEAEFCEYYRLSKQQYAVLKTSQNQLRYALNLQSLGILNQWEVEAKKAISLLEDMTGKTFLVDSIKTQFHAPTPEAIKEEEEKQKNGYYTEQAQAKREEEKKQKVHNELIAERDKKVNEINEEYQVKAEVLFIGGKKALDNCIYYNHSRTLSFNWRSYDRLSDNVVKAIIDKINLPEGIKIENKKPL